ncbi:terpene synthase family protein [Sinomicrobium sp. M5D2P9]
MQKAIQIPKPTYPWPTIQSPLSGTFYEEENNWYDQDYQFLSSEALARYKKMRLVDVGPYMVPTITDRDKVRAIARFVIYMTITDDYVELLPVAEIEAFRDRIFDVMMGDEPRPEEMGILRQMQTGRKEWIALGMPEFWVERIARNYKYRFIADGIMEESPYKISKDIPPVSLFHLIRANSIGMIPFIDQISLLTGFALPDYIYNHTVIQRLVMLEAIIVALQNDFASIKKEIPIESEMFNIITLLQHHNKISFDEACAEGMRIHDEFVDEFVTLSNHLPDFSPYQKETEEFIYYIKLMISGLNSWYYRSGTPRYEPGGYPVPPKRNGETDQD